MTKAYDEICADPTHAELVKAFKKTVGAETFEKISNPHCLLMIKENEIQQEFIKIASTHIPTIAGNCAYLRIRMKEMEDHYKLFQATLNEFERIEKKRIAP